MSAPTSIRDLLRVELGVALKAGDRATVSVVRATLGAIDNAEATDGSEAPAAQGHAHIAGGVGGLGAAEVARRQLSDQEMVDLVREEVAERTAAATAYRSHGRDEAAERLTAEATILEGILGQVRWIRS